MQNILYGTANAHGLCGKAIRFKTMHLMHTNYECGQVA